MGQMMPNTDHGTTATALLKGVQPNLGSLPPELRLALAFLRRDPPDELMDILGPTASQVIDWDLFRRCIVRHRIGPPLYSRLSALDDALVPADLRNWLKRRSRDSALASLLLAKRMVGILRYLHDRQIRVLPFKGVCAAQQIFGALEAREPGDIDLLVAPEDVEAIDGLLRAQGYRRVSLAVDPTRLQSKKIREWLHGLEYVHRSGGTPIDLHWRLFAYRSIFGMQFSTLWDVGEVVDVLGYKVKTLSLEHTLLYLLAHGSSHGWSYLFWICDIAEILRRDMRVDWDAVESEATRTGVCRHVALGLILARGLLGSTLPESVLRWIERQHLSQHSISYCLASLTSSEISPRSLAENIQLVNYRLKLSPKTRYKWEIVWNMRLHVPDWEAVPLPDSLFPVYSVLRPVLWLKRRITGMRRDSMSRN